MIQYRTELAHAAERAHLSLFGYPWIDRARPLMLLVGRLGLHRGADVEVHEETRTDIEAIRHVNELAFGGQDEANIVDALRDSGVVTLSMVATRDSAIVGHILFSPVTVRGPGRDIEAVALGPMSVLPSLQRQGIGSMLVRHGLEACRSLGHDVVFVLGHSDFYPRFGFKRADLEGLQCEFACPPEGFMVVDLSGAGHRFEPGSVVHYRHEFHIG